MKLSDKDKEIMKELEIEEDYIKDFFFQDDLYSVYHESISDDNRLEFFYNYVLGILEDSCQERNIEYSTDTSILFLKVLKDLNEDPYLKEELKEYSFDYTWFLYPEIVDEYINNVVSSCNTVEELDRFIDFLKSVYDNFRAYIASYFSTNIFEHLRELDSKREVIPESSFEFPIRNPDITGELSDFDEEDWVFSDDETPAYESKPTTPPNELTDEKIKEYMEFFQILPLVSNAYLSGKNKINELGTSVNNLKLKAFYKDNKFMEDLNIIMEHNKEEHRFHFHGTQDVSNNETADKIMNNGLLITRDLESTSYPEFTIDQLLLYKRGFGGEIGSRCIVIIDQPIVDGNPTEIVEEIGNNNNYSFVPSGLQGLNNKPKNIVDSKYIVGYVDKIDKKVVLNPLYYDYERLKQRNV